MYTFLSALPAIFGILGFVVFLILRSFGKGDPATLRIVDKLRAEHPDRFIDRKLTARQVHDLLSKDQELRKQVGRQDFIRSRSLKTRSTDGKVPLSHDDYAPLLRTRVFGGSNRLRIVLQTDADAFYSKETALHVGLTLLAAVFDSKVKMAAMIDNRVVDGYNFEAKLVVPRNGDPDFLSIGGKILAAQDYPVPDMSNYDWNAAKLAYLGPDDRRLVRYEVLHN